MPTGDEVAGDGRGSDRADRCASAGAGRSEDAGPGSTTRGGCTTGATGGPAADAPDGSRGDERTDRDEPEWPPLVRAPGCDRETLLRRIVGG